MRYALLGALLMVGGIAARIEAARHHPMVNGGGGVYLLPSTPVRRSGWSPDAYDLVRIGGWGLLIFGAVIVAFALVRELKR